MGGLGKIESALVCAVVEDEDECAEQQKERDGYHWSSNVSGATSARNSSGRCGLGCRARNPGSTTSQNCWSQWKRLRVWQVGKDIDAGTYRATSQVGSDCYWEISTDNGDNIIQNDFPGGGYPEVTVSNGQQLKISSCGTLTKQ